MRIIQITCILIIFIGLNACGDEVAGKRTTRFASGAPKKVEEKIVGEQASSNSTEPEVQKVAPKTVTPAANIPTRGSYSIQTFSVCDDLYCGGGGFWTSLTNSGILQALFALK